MKWLDFEVKGHAYLVNAWMYLMKLHYSLSHAYGTDDRVMYSNVKHNIIRKCTFPAKAYQSMVRRQRPSVCVTLFANSNKKLIRRWDSERELSFWRHRAYTTKYNRHVHKFCHRSTRLCVGTHVFTKFSEITQYNGHYIVQVHSRSPILVPIESSYTTSY